MENSAAIYFETMDELRHAHSKAKGFFFDVRAMRFFKSRIESDKPILGRFFITSEQMDYDSPRLYSLRFIAKGATIETIGEFYSFESISAVNKLIDTFPKAIVYALDFLFYGSNDKNIYSKKEIKKAEEFIKENKKVLGLDREIHFRYK